MISVSAVFTILALVIPFKMSDWIPIEISGRHIPKFRTSLDSELEVTTTGSAGGYVYLLENEKFEVPSRLRLSWEWKVTSFPSNPDWTHIAKSNDDSPLRIGVLISDQASASISIPKSLKGVLAYGEKKLTHIIFYTAAPIEVSSMNVQVSPYQNNIVYCLIDASSKYSTHEVRPLNDISKFFKKKDQKLSNFKVLGLWIFADSDNLKSSSKAYVKNLVLSPQQSPK